MEQTDLSVLDKRYETWELGMLIHLHIRKAQGTSNPVIRGEELEQARICHEVFKYKIEKA